MQYLALVGLLGLVIQASSTDDHCHYSVKQHCSSFPPDGNFIPCTSMYSGAHTVMTDFQDYVLQHLLTSYQYLLMSANFRNYERKRDGFAKLFKNLADDTWEDAVKIIKYMTKRGGSMNFSAPLLESVSNSRITPMALELTEAESMAVALDSHKHLALKAHDIHSKVTKRSHNKLEIHDADVISFLENELVRKHADKIRELAGYLNDLMNLLKDKKCKGPNHAGFSVHLMDQYLSSSL